MGDGAKMNSRKHCKKKAKTQNFRRLCMAWRSAPSGSFDAGQGSSRGKCVMEWNGELSWDWDATITRSPAYGLPKLADIPELKHTNITTRIWAKQSKIAAEPLHQARSH